MYKNQPMSTNDNLTHSQCEPGSRMGDSGKALNLSVFINTLITVYRLISRFTIPQHMIKNTTLQEAYLAQ
jgi:hypothetical protein